GEHSLLAVGTSSGSGKSSLAVGMPCAFYSQQFLGGDKLVSWSSKKQDCTSMSSIEADEDGNPARANVKQALVNRGIATTLKGNVIVGPSRVVKCYNCQGEGHMARQCTQPKRHRNDAWFKEKLMLVEAQEASQILDEDQLAFLADPTKVILMGNLSSCDPEVLFEVPYSDSYPNDMINQDMQQMQYSEQTYVDDFKDNEIHSAHLDKENQTNKMVNESLTAELERYKERITIFEQRLNQEIDTLKETLSNNVKEKEFLTQTLTVFKTESKEKESKYVNKEIVLEKQNKELEKIICEMYQSTQAMHMLTKPHVYYDDTHKQTLGYQNLFYLIKAQLIQPALYDGIVIAKEHAMIFLIDDEETLILEEESRSKMLDKQNYPIDYLSLNKIKDDFGKRVTKKELSA
nr:hypothetical protein [Tanacetum cinerariifolium]